MSHEKRPLAELMQENEEKESLKKGKPTQVATSAARTVTQSDLPPSRQANLDLKRGFPVMPKSSCDFSL